MILFKRICVLFGITVFSLIILAIGVNALIHDFASAHQSKSAKDEIPADMLNWHNIVAHACGEYRAMKYTNSLEALEYNYTKGFRLFEIDFNYTADGHIVLIHDWNLTAARLLGTGGKVYSLEEYVKTKPKGGLTLLSIKSLALWMDKHNDAYIVTDCKLNNTKMLQKIRSEYPKMAKRLLPQMGPFSEYHRLRNMGYDNIILALYKTDYSDGDVVNFVSDHNLLAVSMTQKRAETSLPMRLKKLNMKVYAHTVNSRSKYHQLIEKGVYGVYTDSILPIDSGVPPDAIKTQG
jgi:glycerophosphoryl diester phosphodiesterase